MASLPLPGQGPVAGHTHPVILFNATDPSRQVRTMAAEGLAKVLLIQLIPSLWAGDNATCPQE
jgi:hypothetical protein